MERDFDITDVDGSTIVDYELSSYTVDKEKGIVGSDGITIKLDNGKEIRIWPDADCCGIPWLSVKDNELDEIRGHKFKNIVYDKKVLDIEDQELNDVSLDEYVTSHKITISFYDSEDFTFYIHTAHNGYYDGWINVNVGDST